MEKSRKISKPNPFLYYPVGYLIRLIAKLFLHMKVKKIGLKGEKGPFVVVSNHASTLDFPLLGAAMLPHRLNIVAGKDLFTWKSLRPFLNTMGVIPKAQFGLDIASIRMMMSAVNSGCSLALYPEGKASQDGTNLHYLAPTIGKFLKSLKATVVAVKAQGVYNTKRRFQAGFKRGKIELEIKKLYSVEELKQASPQEIYAKVLEHITFNDNDYQQDNAIVYKGADRAEDLDFILYKCPVCGAEYTLTAKKDLLTCNSCGNTVRFTKQGLFEGVDGGQVVYDRIDKWYAYEREIVRKELEEKGEDFFFSAPVTLHIFDEHANAYLEYGKGTFTLNTQEMAYDGSYLEGNVREAISLQEMASVCTKRCEMLTLPLGDNVWRLQMTDKKWATKITLYVEEIYRIRHGLDG